jgi:aminopeptidase
VEWAVEVYPELPPAEALERLWDALGRICRLDEEDPAAAWLERMGTLKSVASRLGERRFDAIRFHGEGTDLTIGLFRSSRWHAAEFVTVDGLTFYPNIPSEEMFTTPDPARADGYVTATMPKELYGSIVDGIRLELAGGKVVRIDADRGADALRAAVSRDEGASRLGEVALVDGDGRVGSLGTVFLETLLDENAASHIALGSGYELTVEDPAEVERVNQSSIHADLMIGRPDLQVDGLTASGEAVPLLRDGAWLI